MIHRQLMMIEEMLRAGIISEEDSKEMWAKATGMVVYNGKIMTKEEEFYNQIVELEDEEIKK